MGLVSSLRVLSHVRGLAALVVFCWLAVCAYAALRWHIVLAVLNQHAGAARRKWAAERACLTCATILAAVSRVLKLNVTYRLPDHPILRDRTRPLLIVSNHQSTLDGLVLLTLMHNIGRGNGRWIAKRQLGQAPITGLFLHESGSPIIDRTGSPEDLATILTSARQSVADGATFFVFPEGSRFRKTVEGSGYTHVLPPKKRGFLILREELPDYPILSLTLNWEKVSGGKTWLESSAVVGKHVVVIGELIEHLPADQSESWLYKEWGQKDLWLSLGMIKASS